MINWKEQSESIKVLKEGGVAVIPTDTIYGIVCLALSKGSVERVYKIRKRSPDKASVILISSIDEIKKFGVEMSELEERELNQKRDKPTSFILDCGREDLAYLHRGLNSLAFRIPTDENFRNFLQETGPLIAPSANLEGLPPAKNIEEAKKYFGSEVDVYIDAGELLGSPSRIVRLFKDGSVSIIRE